MKTLEDISPIIAGAVIALLFFACEAKAQTAYVADGTVYERYTFGANAVEVPTSSDASVIRLAVQSDSLIQAMQEVVDAVLAREEAMRTEIQALTAQVAQLETSLDTAEAERDVALGDAQRYRTLVEAVRVWKEMLE